MDIMSRTVSVGAVALTVVSTIGCAYGMQQYMAAGSLPNAPRYVTFFVLPANGSVNPDLDRRLHDEVATALVDKGLVETSPEEAEAVVIVNTATPARRSRESFYEGWGGWAWRGEDARSLNGLDAYKAGSLVIDIFDSWTKTLVWHGAADGAVPNGARSSDHALQRAVHRLFKDFPSAEDEGIRRAPDAAPVTADDAMHIIFSPRPAVLVRIDGPPRYEDVFGTELQRITNTNALIVRDESGMHYLRLDGRWMEAYGVEGAWSVAGMVPDGVDVVLQDAMNERRADRIAEASHDHQIPNVVVAMTPAELIVTDGDPEYASVHGTPLLCIRNTAAAVFKEPTDGELYVHVPAGWFRAWTSNGPWQQIADTDLPSDLARARTLTADGS